MKTPTWAYVIGIIMICVGGCKSMTSIKYINMPSLLKVQQQIMDNMTKGFEGNTEDSVPDSTRASTDLMMKNAGDTLKKQFYMSEFTKRWSVNFGYIGLFISLLYILGGIFLMSIRSFSLKLAFSAIGLSILFSIVRAIVLARGHDDGFTALSTRVSAMFAIFTDLIVLIVILISDKSTYKVQS